MTTNGTELLKQLGSGVRPVGGAERAPGGARPVEEQGFQELLSRVAGGDAAGAAGRVVSVEPGSGVRLDAAQLERVGRALDRAEAAGSARAAVLIDGVALEVDVLTRRVTGLIDLKSGAVATRVDAVVQAEGEGPPLDGAGAADAGVLRLTRGGVENASLLARLAG